jgi:hypothetical protein
MVRAIVRTLNAGTVAKVQYATLGGLTGKFRERSLVVMPAGPT